jgi:hypothetical protein
MKKILLIILVVLIVVQFIQPSRNLGGPTTNDITRVVTVPDDVMTLLKKSCYDCHSNHTNYPWYSRITPVNWWLDNHIRDGKHELNFSEFASYSAKKMSKKLDEASELVQKKEMPLGSYTFIHTDAKLNEQQRTRIVEWADAASQKFGGSDEEKD